MSRNRDEIEKIVIDLLLDRPFFGTILSSLEVKWGNHIPTACTDGKAIIINPEFWDTLNYNEKLSTMAHEALHVGLCHHIRGRNLNHIVWNIAADVVINGLLRESGFLLPEGGVVEQDSIDKSTEEIYKELMDRIQEIEPVCCKCGKPIRNGNSGRGDEQDEQKGVGKQNQQSDESGEDKDECGGECGGDCGGSCDHHEQECPCGGKCTPGWGEVITPPDASNDEAEKERVGRVVGTASRIAGNLPSGLSRIIDTMLEPPQVPWDVILADLIRQTASEDYSNRRFSSRHLHRGFYFPSLESPHLNIVVICDTSGSISDEDLGKFIAAIEDVRSVCSTQIQVLYCDCDVYEGEKIFPEDNIVLTPKGGGGTDFRPPFQWIEDHMEEDEVDCAIYLTDGWCDSWPDPQPFPIIWVISSGYNSDNDGDWEVRIE